MERNKKRKKILNKGKFLIFVSSGCSRRPIDCGKLHDYFIMNGWSPAQGASDADFILVYTCGAFQITEKRSLRTIKLVLAKMKQTATLIVTGCLTKINLSVLDGDYLIILPEELHTLDKMIGAQTKLAEIPDANLIPKMEDLIQAPLLNKFSRYFKPSPAFIKRTLKFFKSNINYQFRGQSDKRCHLKIAHGCVGSCSYCAIKIAHGDLKSKGLDSILYEFHKGLKNGHKTFVLNAEDTGCYGLDIGTNFVNLLEKIFATKEDFKLIIQDLNPRWLVQYYQSLTPLIDQHKHRFEEIHIPIQSGSARILHLMKRQYQIEDVKVCLRDLKKRIPNLRIITHVMTGFPSETHADFEQSRKLIQEFDFDGLLVYPYEDRPGTESAGLPDKIPTRIKIKRKKVLDCL